MKTTVWHYGGLPLISQVAKTADRQQLETRSAVNGEECVNEACTSFDLVNMEAVV